MLLPLGLSLLGTTWGQAGRSRAGRGSVWRWCFAPSVAQVSSFCAVNSTVGSRVYAIESIRYVLRMSQNTQENQNDPFEGNSHLQFKIGNKTIDPNDRRFKSPHSRVVNNPSPLLQINGHRPAVNISHRASSGDSTEAAVSHHVAGEAEDQVGKEGKN